MNGPDGDVTGDKIELFLTERAASSSARKRTATSSRGSRIAAPTATT